MVRIAISPLLVGWLVTTQLAAAETELLCFASQHCPPCRRMQPIIEQLRSAGYPVRRIDVSRREHRHLALEYGIPRVPCFVMIHNGQEVARIEGATGYANLQALLNRVVPKPQVVSLAADAPQTPDPTPMIENVGFQSGTNGRVPRPMAKSFADRTPAPLEPQALTSSTPRPSSLNRAMVEATVRIQIEDPVGRSKGTGTIIDARDGEALVLTCGHIFRSSQGQGRISVDLFRETPGGPVQVETVEGTLIAHHENPDLGLLAIRVERPIAIAALAARESDFTVGQAVHTSGCSNGADPTVAHSSLSGVNRFAGPENLEVAGAPVEGRSGGGLFDAQGQLIGVCYAAEPVGNEGLYVSLPEIYQLLDNRQLTAIIASPRGSSPPRADLVAARDQSLQVRGQDPSNMPLAAVEPTTAADSTPPASYLDLPPAERAALEEIAALSVNAEVVCIIRPKNAAGRSEIIRLDDVSPAFLRALTQR